ncbi:hypothetical protein FTUN_7888 [Frigoriglobus tundricola]|uniref:Uncharacterized protein n=1 Tax=Frigoriglobus tundricola TaxID=2774151 RepID=A0A6M5Z4W0_9BACT|nr:hypothetical protein FTUN_7888 [Frigoriglobus tundricola]
MGLGLFARRFTDEPAGPQVPVLAVHGGDGGVCGGARGSSHRRRCGRRIASHTSPTPRSQ